MTGEINAAKDYAQSEFDFFKKTFNAVPEDRLNYSPSSTARTPLRVAAHAALSNYAMAKMLRGEQIEFKSADEADRHMGAEEKKVTTRAGALEMLDSSLRDLLDTLSSIPEEKLNETCSTPFGEYPMNRMIFMPGKHLAMHASQIDYIQTIWGDLEYHM